MPSDRPTKPHGRFTPANKISRVLGSKHKKWVARATTAFGGYRCTWDAVQGLVRVTHRPGDEVTDEEARRTEREEMITEYEQTLTERGYHVQREHGVLYVNPVKEADMPAPKPTITEQIKALATLRKFARDTSRNSLNELSRETAKAVNTLDNADLFADLDQERNAQEAAKEDHTP